VTVTLVDPAGSAAISGIQTGDIILKVQRTNVTAADQVPLLIATAPPEARHFAAVLMRRGMKPLWMAVRVRG
jgi:S1-C subfamily serine protease